MTLGGPVQAEVAARRAGVPVAVVRRLEQSGVVSPSSRSDRGVPLYSEEDIRRITAAWTLESETVLTDDEVKRVLEVGALVAAHDLALEKATTSLHRRTILELVLAELGDVRSIVARRQRGLVALDEQLRAWEARVRESGRGPGAQGRGPAHTRR